LDTYALAEYGGDQWNDYWEERYHLQDVLDNYNGECLHSMGNARLEC